MINKKMTIAEAVKENPKITSKLEETGIDFCCGGDDVLEDAIMEIGFDVDSYINILNSIEKPAEMEEDLKEIMELSTPNLIDYIIDTHHIKELELIEKIDANLRKLIKVHYESHSKELADIYEVFLLMKTDLIPHFASEERDEFPRMMDGETVDFSTLIAEHEKVGSLLERMKGLTSDYTAPSDGCMTYENTFELLKELQDDLHRHIFLENSVLFTRN